MTRCKCLCKLNVQWLIGIKATTFSDACEPLDGTNASLANPNL